MSKFKRRLHKAFGALEENGYFAPPFPYWCCTSCAASAAAMENPEKFVVYHDQDESGWRNRGGMYLTWEGNPKEIIAALIHAGLSATWDEDPSTKIWVDDPSRTEM